MEQYYFLHFEDVVELSITTRSWHDNHTARRGKYKPVDKDLLQEDDCVLYHSLWALANVGPIRISGLRDGTWTKAHHLEISISGNAFILSFPPFFRH